MKKLLLAHEAFFGAFLLVTWTRFAAKLGPASPEALLYLGLILLDGLLIALCLRKPGRLRWFLRLLFHPVAMNILFLHMKGAIPKIAPHRMDVLLQGIDGWMVGGNLSLRMEPLVRPWLTEALSFCYLLFFPYLLFSMVWYFRKNLSLTRSFCAGLFTIYGLGFLGYSFVPAWGPWVAMADRFQVPLLGGPLTQLNDRIVRAGSNGVDVFPSLHCAISAFLLLFDRRHTPWRFRIYLLPCLGLWVSTLYLRYHYAVDLLFGFFLAAFALWISRKSLEQDLP